MIEITVTVYVYDEKGSSPFPNKPVPIPLILRTLAPVTPDDAKSKSFGRWECSSYYLGADKTNNYFVQRNDKVPENPVGSFLDSEGKDDDPFLILKGFNPMSMKVGDEGRGRLLRTKATDVKWTDVDWRRTK